MTGQNKPLGWYCVSNDGRATLCMDEQDARDTVAQSLAAWPASIPHRAMQLCEYTPHQNGFEQNETTNHSSTSHVAHSGF